ncbi:transient receptor potential cation channel subfamily M member 2-like isoform X2 [Lissotriton helveticus]
MWFRNKHKVFTEEVESCSKESTQKKQCTHLTRSPVLFGHRKEVCYCGNGKSQNLHENTNHTEPEMNREKHIEEVPTNAFGDLTFEGPEIKKAKYVRASINISPKVLYEMMTDHWQLSKPNLVISVTGGAKHFNMNPRLKDLFSKGLVKAARRTGAWIITNGCNAGLTKLVGEVLCDFIRSGRGHPHHEIVAIGIAPWGTVHNRNRLISKEGVLPTEYCLYVDNQGSLCCLDNNHSHFILVDDGTQGSYGIEIPLRTKLERFISEQTMKEEGADTKIPIVCVVLAGGPVILNTVHSSLTNNTPCVVVEGSGRVADVIAQVADMNPTHITMAVIREKLRTLFFENFSEKEIIEWTKKIQDIVRRRQLITIFREEKGSARDVDVAMALLKASQSMDYNNWTYQLKLALLWNRLDIAKRDIFNSEWSWRAEDLYPVLTIALMEDKPNFVQLFLDQGVSLQKYVTRETLTHLYNTIEPTFLFHQKLEKIKKDQNENQQGVNLHHVEEALKSLLGKLPAPLYFTTEPQTAVNITSKDRKDSTPKDMPEYPVKVLESASLNPEAIESVKSAHITTGQAPSKCLISCLLIWAVVQNRRELAEILWAQTFLTKIWWGELSDDNSLIRVLICLVFFPLVCTGFITFRNTSLHTLTRMERLYGFFTAPVVVFCYNIVLYVGFLWLFAHVLILDFQTTPSWREYLLYIWIFSFLCEEVRQLLNDHKHLKFLTKGRIYITNFWNQVDVVAISLFTVGAVCRWFKASFYAARVILSVDFIVFSVRLVDSFTQSRVLGPKIIMVQKMVKDLFFFLFLLAIWIVSFGVSKHAIRVHNEQRLGWIFRSTIYEPYLILFGQIPADVDKLNFNNSTCTADGSVATQPKCAETLDGVARFPEWLTIILLCLYLLSANILLLNLLIAMFSYTFSEVQGKTDQIWKFQRHRLIKEYSNRPSAPPPLIIFNHLYYLVRKKKQSALESDVIKTAGLLSWEENKKEKYLSKRREAQSQSTDMTIRDISNKVDAVAQLSELAKNVRAIEQRLMLQEEQVSQSLNWIMKSLTEKKFASKEKFPLIEHLKTIDAEDSNSGDIPKYFKSEYHVHSRQMMYPGSNVKRFPVPDELVPWTVNFPLYDPTPYEAETAGSQPKSEYTKNDELPLNPEGRTGVKGLGSLQWYGPNQSLHLVLTRRKRDQGGSFVWKDSKKVLEVLAVKPEGSDCWEFPGGILRPGEKLPSSLKAILKKEYWERCEEQLEKGFEVYKGYLDDPRNTDNAWVETSTVSVHFESPEELALLESNLPDLTSTDSIRWKIIAGKIFLYANMNVILDQVADNVNAHY